MKALYEKGNLDSIGKKFAGVSGKTVKRINAYVGEEGEPGICIDFTDGTVLDITVGSNPNVTADWFHVKDDKPPRRANFL
jgi:hypothetical protein